jgi:glyoxylase-like metal-dependent hydrolase (beta-lactamase superfamily II)/predicted ester cyclase
MASTSEIARRYFAALDAHDLDAALALWEPGALDRFPGQRELTAPHGIRAYFGDLFTAFPDFRLRVDELTTYRDRTAVRWTASGTFAGPGRFEGFAPNGARIELQGCDVVRVSGERIVGNDAYMDSGALARQLGFLPEPGSPTQERLAALANLGTQVRGLLSGDSPPEPIADGVWLVRGGFPRKVMNVYLIRDGDGVAVFDAGVSAMGASLRAAVATLGGATRVVLGHADCDHRGAAPGLGVPVLCHERELEAARSPEALRSYWDLRRLPPLIRQAYGQLLLPSWDGGALEVADTVAEGDEIAGFRVIELPGHAPGLIGLVRESDRLALVSDCIYTIDPLTTVRGAARIPHPAFNEDSLEARRSILKLADLGAEVVWAGHADPVTGDVAGQLREAAAAIV